MTFKEVWEKGKDRLNRKLIRASLFWFLLLVVIFLLLSTKV